MWHSEMNLAQDCRAIVAGEKNLVANLANVSSVLFHSLPNLNWCGFYLLDTLAGDLVLGPFQGRPACIRIARGRGVCGAAWAESKTMVVDDVDSFPGHIACDAASQSELVVPLFWEKRFCGVLDLDSPVKNRFGPELVREIEALAREVVEPLFSEFFTQRN